MAENIYPSKHFFAEISSSEMREIRNNCVPVFADDHCTVYRVNGKLIVDDPAPVQSCCDRAVIEAGFATEPLRHCVTELMTYLYVRMLEDGMRGFSEGEWQAIDEACDLLEIDRKNRA